MNKPGQMVANPFGATERQQNALAASEESKAVAEIQSMLVIAKKFPRDPKTATDSILRECARQGMAEVALYSYSRGGTEITGPSIRLAETIARGWGNFEFGFREVSRGRDADGVTYSEIVAYAWDLESNTRRPVSFRARHWRDTKKGGYAITDERDIYEMIANQAQRRVRACILGVVPGDVVEQAQRQCEETLRAHADTSPDGIKKMLAKFAEIGVSKDQIERRIQRRIETILPAQVIQLRNTFNSIRDGMSTPADWFDTSLAAPETAAAAASTLPPYPQGQLDANLPKWRTAIEAKRQSPQAIIAMLSSKYALSDEQKRAIEALDKPVVATQSQPIDSSGSPDWFADYDNAMEKQA